MAWTQTFYSDFYLTQAVATERREMARDRSERVTRLPLDLGPADEQRAIAEGQPEVIETVFNADRVRVAEGGRRNGLKEGRWREYHLDGAHVRSEGTYEGDLREGLWTYFYDDGQKSSEGTYSKGRFDGKWVRWHRNGREMQVAHYRDNVRDGEWRLLDADGHLLESGTYENGRRTGYWTFLDEFGNPDGARTGEYVQGIRRRD